MSVVEHLEELRRRILWSLLALTAGVTVSFAFSRTLLRAVEWPLRGTQLVFLHPLELVYSLIKLSVVAGAVLASPVILYQAVAFVLPALTRQERRYLFRYLPAGLALFCAGAAFGFFVFLPFVLRFALGYAAGLVRPEISLERYITFVLSMTLPFGLLFELPVVVLVLVRLDVLTAASLARGRKWALLGTVVLAAIFAPPDMVSPILMSLPIYGLYEVSVWVARLAARGRPVGRQGGGGTQGASSPPGPNPGGGGPDRPPAPEGPGGPDGGDPDAGTASASAEPHDPGDVRDGEPGSPEDTPSGAGGGEVG
jgi:sec-independent protein translocase protein TatC